MTSTPLGRLHEELLVEWEAAVEAARIVPWWRPFARAAAAREATHVARVAACVGAVAEGRDIAGRV